MIVKNENIKYKVLFLSGSLQLSGSTTWMNSLILAFQNTGVPTVHLVTSMETEIKSAAIEVCYTNRARKHFPIRILRFLQLHKIFPTYYAGKEEDFFNKYAMQLFKNNNEKVLVIKDFNSYLPSFFKNEQFVVVDVMHNNFTTYEAGYCRDYLISVSETMMKQAGKLGFSVDGYIYNPLDRESVKSKAVEYEIEEDNYILYVGSLIKEKGVLHLIEAYHELLKEGKVSQKLVYIGNGREAGTLKEYIKKNKLSEQIVLKGFLNNPYPYIKNAKLLVLPSYSEVMPYVAIEAAALNTSYLVSDFLGSDEFFPRENIFSIDKNSNIFNDNLKRKILHLLKFPAWSLKSGLDEEIVPEKAADSYCNLLHIRKSKN